MLPGVTYSPAYYPKFLSLCRLITNRGNGGVCCCTSAGISPWSCVRDDIINALQATFNRLDCAHQLGISIRILLRFCEERCFVSADGN
jgi:hypothetical protein